MHVGGTIHDPLACRQPIVIPMAQSRRSGVGPGENIRGQDLRDPHRDGSSSRIPWRQ